MLNFTLSESEPPRGPCLCRIFYENKYPIVDNISQLVLAHRLAPLVFQQSDHYRPMIKLPLSNHTDSKIPAASRLCNRIIPRETVSEDSSAPALCRPYPCPTDSSFTFAPRKKIPQRELKPPTTNFSVFSVSSVANNSLDTQLSLMYNIHLTK